MTLVYVLAFIGWSILIALAVAQAIDWHNDE